MPSKLPSSKTIPRLIPLAIFHRLSPANSPINSSRRMKCARSESPSAQCRKVDEDRSQARRCREHERRLKEKSENIQLSLAQDKERRKTLRIKILEGKNKIAESEKQINELNGKFRDSQRQSSKATMKTQHDLNVFTRQKTIRKAQLDKTIYKITKDIEKLQTAIENTTDELTSIEERMQKAKSELKNNKDEQIVHYKSCLLYTSDAADK